MLRTLKDYKGKAVTLAIFKKASTVFFLKRKNAMFQVDGFKIGTGE